MMPAVQIDDRGEVLPSDGESRLVWSGDKPPVHTLRCDTDARTALMRGLRDYVARLEVVDPAGKVLRFAKVKEGWSEPEAEAQYPWACVYGPEEGPYTPIRLAPKISAEDQIGESDFYLVETSVYEAVLRVEFWASLPEERYQLNRGMEDEFQFPAETLAKGEEKYGFRLELPHYHGLRASYSPMASGYVESGDDARSGRFKGWQRVIGRVPVCRVVTRPRARIKHRESVNQ